MSVLCTSFFPSKCIIVKLFFLFQTLGYFFQEYANYGLEHWGSDIPRSVKPVYYKTGLTGFGIGPC